MTRRATIRTECVSSAADASMIASSIAPDNTDDMTTSVQGTTVTTIIDRKSTRGLQATVDDYVINLGVAVEMVRDVSRADTTSRSAHRSDTNTPSVSSSADRDDEPGRETENDRDDETADSKDCSNRDVDGLDCAAGDEKAGNASITVGENPVEFGYNRIDDVNRNENDTTDTTTAMNAKADTTANTITHTENIQ